MQFRKEGRRPAPKGAVQGYEIKVRWDEGYTSKLHYPTEEKLVQALNELDADPSVIAHELYLVEGGCMYELHPENTSVKLMLPGKLLYASLEEAVAELRDIAAALEAGKDYGTFEGYNEGEAWVLKEARPSDFDEEVTEPEEGEEQEEKEEEEDA